MCLSRATLLFCLFPTWGLILVNKNAVSTSLALTSWEIFGARMGSGWATTTTTISAIRLEQIRASPQAREHLGPPIRRWFRESSFRWLPHTWVGGGHLEGWPFNCARLGALRWYGSQWYLWIWRGDNSCDDDDDDHDGRGGRTGENQQGNGKGIEVNDWFYHPFRYPGNKSGRGTTIGDKPDDHPDSGDDVDTTNGITCLSGTEWLIWILFYLNYYILVVDVVVV